MNVYNVDRRRIEAIDHVKVMIDEDSWSWMAKRFPDGKELCRGKGVEDQRGVVDGKDMTDEQYEEHVIELVKRNIRGLGRKAIIVIVEWW